MPRQWIRLQSAEIRNSKTYPIVQPHIGREQSLCKVVTIKRDLKVKERRAERHLLNEIIRIRTAGSQRRSHLCNEQIFRERRKSNDLLEQPLPLILSKEVSANDQFKRVIASEHQLISTLVAIALAKDQLFVDLQLIVPCPGTLSDVVLDEMPIAAIVGSVPG